MDPDAALFAIRELAAAIAAADEVSPWQAHELAEHVQALDAWITKGGFLPKDWQPAHNPTT